MRPSRAPDLIRFSFAYDRGMVDDRDAEKIRKDIEDGVRGPVLVKYIRALLRDRQERIAARKKRPIAPG
jgi:hypothetical protein